MSASYWTVIPAAGIGTRVGSVCPKQYLLLCGKEVIEHSLQRLLTHSKIAGAVVALAPDDQYGKNLLNKFTGQEKPVITVEGGAERCHSVLNALHRLTEFAGPHDWVLVHDAVRPCLRQADIDRLIDTTNNHPDGGLLGMRVTDTVKRVTASGKVGETINRDDLWRAQTPQIFQLAALTQALSQAIEQRLNITDEAAAMSLAGAVPMMVEGHADNIKITHFADLALAQFYLEQQEAGA
ncbi:MAG: 2-C-methyl-D-erythritol 4-phosphate cytidylyltransferase [Gammaproteobacteria bacterium]